MTAKDAIRHLKYIRTGVAIERLSLLTSSPERSLEAQDRVDALTLGILALEREYLLERERAATASSFANYGFLAPPDIDPNGSSFGSDP